MNLSDASPLGMRGDPQLVVACASIRRLLVGPDELDSGDASCVGRYAPTPIRADRRTKANITHLPPDRGVVRTDQGDFLIGRRASAGIIDLFSDDEGMVGNDARRRYPEDAGGQESGRTINYGPPPACWR